VTEAPIPPAPDPPAWFWNTIQEAGGQLDRFRTALGRLSREQVIQMNAYWRDLARVFGARRYVANMEPGTSEDGALDIGEWIVSQGRGYFRDVYDHPEKVPKTERPGTKDEQMMFGEILEHYLDTYDDDMPTNVAPDYSHQR
jgi:Protein of unknown function (DUF4240)